MRTTILELVEEPGLWLPPDPLTERIAGDGYTVVVSGPRASVERIRLPADGIRRAVDAVRELGRARELEQVTWWVGACSTPPELAARLLELGLAPDPETPSLAALALDRAPAGEPAVEMRRVESEADFLRALALDWECFDVPAGERAARRAAAHESWSSLLADGRTTLFLAYDGDDPVGFGRLVMTPSAGLLLGGATLPEARRRGVYTALVHARWHEAAARGVPRLAVAAGPHSTPILEQLGFERLGIVRLLGDRL